MDTLREVLSGGKIRVLSLARVSGVKRSLSNYFANSESARLPTSATFCFPLRGPETVDGGTGCGVAGDWGQSLRFRVNPIKYQIRMCDFPSYGNDQLSVLIPVGVDSSKHCRGSNLSRTTL